MYFLNKRPCRLVMLAALICCGASQAEAGELPGAWQGDEIVVTATRTPNPISKLPVAVEVISRQQIDQSGALNLADVLTEAHDINALEPTSGRLGVARLRGLDSRLTLVLIDGYRITSGFQGYVDLHEIPSGMIERVEIVRGAGSALYGSDAVGGVVNVITRQPSRELHGGLSVSGGESRYGEAGTFATDGWLSGITGKLGFSVAGSWYNRGSYDRNPSDLTTDGDHRAIGSGSTALTYNLTPTVRLSTGFIYADNHLDGLRSQSAGDFDRSVSSDRLLGYAGLDVKTGDDSNLSLRVSRTTYDWSSDMANVNGLPYVAISISGATKTTTETTTTTRTKVVQDSDQFDAKWTGSLADAHRVTAGVEYLTENREDYSRTVTKKVVTKSNVSTGLITSGPTTMVTTDEPRLTHDANNLGLFMQDEITVFSPLTVIAGLRFDDHSDFGSEVSPKIAALMRIDDHLKLRASYGEGFRAPSLYELYTGAVQTKKSIILANPALDAERSRTYELGADVSLGSFNAGVTGFRNEIRSMISQVLVDATTTPATYQFRNLAQAMTRGLEINASLKLSEGFTLSDQVTLLDTRDETTGRELLFAPAATNIVRIDGLSKRLGLKGNIRVVTTGSQYISSTEKVGAYSLVNCYLSKSISRSSALFAGVDNLFNSDANAAYGNNEGAGMTGTYLYGGVNFHF